MRIIFTAHESFVYAFLLEILGGNIEMSQKEDKQKRNTAFKMHLFCYLVL